MILYKLGLTSDAFSIPVLDIVIVITIFMIALILAIFVVSNLSESSYATNAIDEFLQDHKFLASLIALVLAFIAAASMAVTSDLLRRTAPNTIVDSSYILKNSIRSVESKDDFKTVYANEEDVEFSSKLGAMSMRYIPEEIRQSLRSNRVCECSPLVADENENLDLFSTHSDLDAKQIEALKVLSEFKHVIEINASKADSSVKILATIDSIELTKEEENEENEENMTYHIDKIEMTNAVETISRDSHSKSRDIKSVKLHISGKTSESAKARKSIEKLVE